MLIFHSFYKEKVISTKKMLPKHFTRTEHRAGLPHLDKPLMRQNPIDSRPVWGTNKQINKKTRKQTEN